MSVYKSKRGESAMQFVETARQLEAHTFACCMKTPKRYSFLLTTRIMELAMEVHERVRAANNIWPTNQHEAQLRRDELLRANIALQNLNPKLQHCLEEMRRECAALGIRFNEKKTAVIPIAQGTKFLKTKFKLTETGKVVRKMNRKGTRKMREKLKKFRARMDAGTMTEEDIRTAYESWRGHMRRGNSWRVLRRMDRFYESLFGEGGQSCTK